MALLDIKVIYHVDKSRKVTLVIHCKVETVRHSQTSKVRHNLLQDMSDR